MQQYLAFMALLIAVYLGYRIVQAKEKKRMKRYYGYSRRREAKTFEKRAA